jgi:predicted phosphodiesterase
MLPNSYLRIAVISDLHCQKEKNSGKSRLHTQLLDHPIKDNPVESLKHIISQEKKIVDYFFVLGDVADKGNLEGFILGVKYIKEIYTLLNADKLIFTIGNHDMHRKVKDDTVQDSEYMMKRTNGFPFLFKDNKSIDALEKDFWAKKYCIVEDDKAITLILNTSCFMDHVDNLKSLIFDESMFESINTDLNQYYSSNKFKIAICHHHPNQHSDINAEYTSLDCIDRGDKLIELLKNNNFAILMHGHKHFPRLKYDDGFPVFCSGSFSSLENTSNFQEDNTVHFINIYMDSQGYKGLIETWIYNSIKGWQKSTDMKPRFPVYTGFKKEAIDVTKLVNDIYSHFYSNFKEDDMKQYISIPLNEVALKFEEVDFLTPSQQIVFEGELEKHYIEISFGKKGKALQKQNIK